MSTTTTTVAPSAVSRSGSAPRTRTLLACGIASGPLFLATAALQATFRDGFDLARHPLSLLSLGAHGWIQIANFIMAGVLSLAYAFGLRRSLHVGPGHVWAPRLIGVYGVGLIVAGVFVADPSLGFPVGTPEGATAQLSWHAMLHGVGTMLAFPPLIAACFVLARRYATQQRRGWAAYSAATGLSAVLLTGWPSQEEISIRLAVAAAVTFAWVSVTGTDLLRRTPSN